jgi:hypothetical protein
MITYSFKITSINRLILYIDEEGNRYENLITKINYYYQGINDDGITAIYNSFVELDKPTSTNYKAYDSLIESDLITWLESLISDTEILLMKTVISNNIDDITTKASSLPWQI